MTRTEELTKTLKNTKNLIMHGAPGVGKTYLAKNTAAYMHYKKSYAELDEKEKEELSEFVRVVQFHPSYDYTDFVEGIRPTNNASDTTDGFVRMDGTFKDFCKRCIDFNNKRREEREEYNESKISELVTDYFATEKFINVDLDGKKYKYRVFFEDDKKIWIKIKDTASTCSFSVEKQLLIKYLLDTESVTFEPIKKAQKKVFEYIYNRLINDLPFIFIIDEINRGELSKIFGELFFSIDPDYRGEDGLVQTQYQNLVPDGDIFKKGFYVPENVYIIGTMNDIDRSVESMDFAMRRRFTFEEIKVEDTQDAILAGLDAGIRDKAKIRMNLLNNAISETEGLSSSYHIGAAYFLKLNKLNNDFDLLWKYNLNPLLQEYLRGQGDEEEKLNILKAAYDSADNANAENAS